MDTELVVGYDAEHDVVTIEVDGRVYAKDPDDFCVWVRQLGSFATAVQNRRRLEAFFDKLKAIKEAERIISDARSGGQRSDTG